MRHLGTDPYSGISEYFSLDDVGNWVIKTVQDAEPWVKKSAFLAGQFNKKEDWWYIGSTPPALDLKWAEESGTKVYTPEWAKYAHKKLNDPEYSKFNPNRIKLG